MEHEITPPYTCKFCGAPSWYEPSEQIPPPDYCHESDHGWSHESDHGWSHESDHENMENKE